MNEQKKKDFMDWLQAVTSCSGRKIDRFLEWLESTDFFTAPSSTRFHGAFEGGLVEHSMNVGMYLDSLNAASGYLVEPFDTSAVVGLLHDICKTGVYKPCKKNVKVNGKWEEQDGYCFEDSFPIGHGEKSVILALQAGLKLHPQEAVAIRWHMGTYKDPADELRRVWMAEKTKDVLPLSINTHLADMIACNIEENPNVDEAHKISSRGEEGTSPFYMMGEGSKACGPDFPKSHEEHYKALIKAFLPDAVTAMEKFTYNPKHSDFFAAPATDKAYGAFEGGLCRHALRMFYAMLWVCDLIRFKVPISTIAGCTLLANLGGIKKYVPEIKKVKDADGNWTEKTIYQLSENLLFGGMGAKSIYQIQALGIKTSKDERLAIRWHMGEMDETDVSRQHSSVFSSNLLAFVTYVAYMIAAYGNLEEFKVRNLW